MAQIKLIEGFREEFYPMTTIGLLYLNKQAENSPFCSILEDTVRPGGIKVQDNTAIPAEVLYSVSTRYSNHLKREVLVLYTEPDRITIKGNGVKFTYVYFHALNNDKQTDGCVGIGFSHSKGSNTISDARKAENALFKRVKEWMDAGYEVKAIFHNGKQSV